MDPPSRCSRGDPTFSLWTWKDGFGGEPPRIDEKHCHVDEARELQVFPLERSDVEFEGSRRADRCPLCGVVPLSRADTGSEEKGADAPRAGVAR